MGGFKEQRFEVRFSFPDCPWFAVEAPTVDKTAPKQNKQKQKEFQEARASSRRSSRASLRSAHSTPDTVFRMLVLLPGSCCLGCQVCFQGLARVSVAPCSVVCVVDLRHSRSVSMPKSQGRRGDCLSRRRVSC
eukprot:m.1885 g.1885  ORF g.1885 m.1885 type:complete len:133 (+) comp753_c1_seq1:150-548(+)